MKSGYGFQEKVTTHVSTNQSSAVTSAQNAVTYFPEFQYERFWRLLERMNGGYDMTHELRKMVTVPMRGERILHQFGIRMEVIRHILGCWIAGHRLECSP